MECISNIRREHGLDIHVSDLQAQSAIMSLRSNLERALTSLSEELYAKPTHFLLELIQNADDNQYTPEVDPTLSIDLVESERVLIIQCNELGFTETNVRAICSIGKSTKKGQEGYIGEKGIGFKSVFKIADVVYVLSNIYRFKFDKRTELGMIAPIWTDEYHPSHGYTSIRLHLSPVINLAELRNSLGDIGSSLLLFLRKLCKIEVTIGDRNLTCSRHDDNHGIIRLEHSDGSQRQFLITKYPVKSMPMEPKRENVTESEVVLGFPLADDHSPLIQEQDVHAFLPIRRYGFKFLIQADFLLAANREDILSDLPWNHLLRKSVAPAFCAAVSRFTAFSNLKFKWPQYIPSYISDTFMQSTRSEILTQLQNMAIVHCSDGTSRKATAVVACGPHYTDTGDSPLIPQKFLPSNLRYLSPKYEGTNVLTALKDIGVREMDAEIFISGLEAMCRSRVVQQQSEEWLEASFSVLLDILKSKQGQLYILRVKHLPIAPLTDSLWIPVSTPNLFLRFDALLDEIPEDLGIQLVKRFTSACSHHQLLLLLGIRNADRDLAVNRIAMWHQSPSFDQGHASYAPSHARFIFRHRFFIHTVPQLRVLTRAGCTVKSQDAYMNHSRHHILPLDTLLPASAPFLHEDYYQSIPGVEAVTWLDWIHSQLGVNACPRVIWPYGYISIELKQFLNNAPTVDIMKMLRQYWTDLENTQMILHSPEALGVLRSLIVETSDGQKHRLDATFIDHSLSNRFPELPYLPLDTPTDPAWDFLRYLGVTFNPDAMLYLKRLKRLSTLSSSEVSNQEVEECYTQLAARFDDDNNGNAICESFALYSLIFIPASSNRRGQGAEWTSLPNIVWSGPHCMRSKTSLAAIYPHLEHFWRYQVQVPDCPDDILLQEFQKVALDWKFKPLDEETHLHLYNLLEETSNCLGTQHMPPSKSHPSPLNWLPLLCGERIFPVKNAARIITLAKLGENFYVPDESGELEDLFIGYISLLHLPRGKIIRDLWPLLRSEPFHNVQYLKECVQENTLMRGVRIPDTTLSNNYIARVPFIKRLLDSVRSHLSNARAISIATKLEGIKCYHVDSIVYTYTLGATKRLKQEDVAIEESDSNIHIYVSKTCTSGPRDILLCSRLSRLLNLDSKELLPILTLPLNSLNIYLKSQGIHERDIEIPIITQDLATPQQPGVPPTPEPSTILANTAKSEARSAQQSPVQQLSLMQQISPRNTQPLPVGARQGSIPAGWKPPAEFIPARMSKQVKSQKPQPTASYIPKLSSPQDMTQSSLLAPQPSEPTISPVSINAAPPPTYTVVPPPDLASPVEHKSTTGLIAPLSEFARTSRERSVSGTLLEDETHGIAGEYYVYQLLLKELPQFGPDNWTSELRYQVPGFPPYHETSYADFTYDDCKGYLTGRLFGPDIKTRWHEQGRWPRYHLEVKSTPGSRRTPFHVSFGQLDTASKMAIQDMNTAPANVFVLVRISSLSASSGSTACVFICDLHRALYDGRVKVASDVEMVLS